jgi:hypothetical protein
VTYSLWQGNCLVKDADSRLSFSEFENDLGDSYYSQLLYGSEAGNRAWSITMPSLQDGSASRQFEGIGGTSLTGAKYIMDLFGHCKRTGQPFVYQDPLTENYYFARFADRELSYSRVLSKLWSSGVQLKQCRIPGVSVFDPSEVEYLWAHYNPETFLGTSWPDATGSGHSLSTVSGDVQHVANAKNGQKIVRINAAGGGGIISSSLDVTVYDCIAVMKIREDTFSSYQGFITGQTTGTVFVGLDGTTYFDYLGGDVQYWKNGIEYVFDGQQAPMNAWGIVHVRYLDGVSITNLQLGQDRDYLDRPGLVDFGDICISDQLIPMDVVAELIESLAAKWRINVIE